jgi:hypothetical protein
MCESSDKTSGRLALIIERALAHIARDAQMVMNGQHNTQMHQPQFNAGLMNTTSAMNAKVVIPHVSMPFLRHKSAGSKAVLEAYARDELSDDQLIDELLLCCRADSDATREALSLLDEYHRRGLLETSIFLTTKTELNMLVLNLQPTSRTGAAVQSSALTALEQFSSGIFEAK